MSKPTDRVVVLTESVDMTSKEASRWIIKTVRQQMKARRIKKSHLAATMKVSPPCVTKLLRGKENLTLETIEKLANALGMTMQVHLHL